MDKSKRKAKVIRPCGKIESFSTARHSLGIYRCVAVTCRYAIPQNVSLDPASLKKLLYPALAQVILRQPFMTVGITGEETKRPYFVHVPSIDLYKHIRWYSIAARTADQFDGELIEIAAMQHDQLWSELSTSPPWKLRVVPRPGFGDESPSVEIMYAYHHAIGDGMSGKIFHSQLLEAFNNSAATVPGLEGSTLSLPKAPILPKPQEEVVKFTITWPFFFKTLWKEFGPKWLVGEQTNTPWRGRAIDLSLRYETNIRLVNIPSAAVPPVLAACREHKTTMTALVNILMLASLARRLPQEDAPAFTAGTAISLRPYVPSSKALNPKETIHVLVTQQHHDIREEMVTALRTLLARQSLKAEEVDARVWDLATAMKAEIQHKADTLPADDQVGLLKWIDNWHAWLKKKDGKPRDLTWELSNIGTLDGGPGDGGWTVTRAVFTQSAMVAGAAIGVNMAGIVDGQVTIALTWAEKVVDNTMMRGVAADIDAWLLRFGQDGSFGILPWHE